MTNQTLQNFISTNFPLYQPQVATIYEMEERSEKVKFRKNEILFAEGKVPHKFAFVEQGNLMAYSRESGKKTIQRFWFPLQPIFLSAGFMQQIPLKQSIIALNDCSLIILSYNKITEITQNHPNIWQIINLFSSYENFLLQEYTTLLKLGPKKRYHQFMQKHPELWQLLSAELLATYLNIGYSTFARFRQGR